MSKWLYENAKTGMVVKSSFSQTNFDVSQEFYYDSLGEIFLKLDLIIERFVKINQITVNQLDDIYERRFSIYWIKYFNRSHYNKACDLCLNWNNKCRECIKEIFAENNLELGI